MIEPEPRLQHGSSLGLTAEKNGFEVEVEHPVPIGLADVLNGAAQGNASAIDADVQPTPVREDGIDHVFDLVLGGDICSNC